jgi:hypothetical protein
MPAVVLNLTVGPRDGAVELQCRRAAVTKNDEDMFTICGGRRCCIGILAFLAPWYLFTAVFQRTLPLLRSRQRTRHWVALSVAVVTKMRLPQTTGEDQPAPGMDVFQTTFDVALQCSGSFFSEEIPWPVGPRKRGQFSADSEKVNAHRAAMSRRVFIGCQTVMPADYDVCLRVSTFATDNAK